MRRFFISFTPPVMSTTTGELVNLTSDGFIRKKILVEGSGHLQKAYNGDYCVGTIRRPYSLLCAASLLLTIASYSELPASMPILH